MKIQLKSFGPIADYTFDTEKDFQLIFGENNIGKSYALTGTYLILKNLLNLQGISFRMFGLFSDNALKKLETKLRESEERDADVSITTEFKAALCELIERSFASALTDSLRGSFDFDNLKSQYNGSPLSICIYTDRFSLQLEKSEHELQVKEISFKERVFIKCSRTNRSTRQSGGNIYVYNNLKDRSHFESSYQKLIYQFYFSLYLAAATSISGVHFLPASRSGLYQALSAFGQVIAELSQSRSFLRKKIELPSISEPLTDYFLKLSEIRVPKKKSEPRPEEAIAEDIEENILRGSVTFDPKTKRILYSPKNTSLELDISFTSSMVSEISPIVSYIKYIIGAPEDRELLSHNPLVYPPRRFRGPKSGKPILFIEEPEAHLHPEIQTKLIKVFFDLAKSGVKVVMTTHSNFVFNKANNLIIGGAIDTNAVSAQIFKSDERGTTSSMLGVDEYGIDDENFIEVTEDLAEERMRLLEEKLSNSLNLDTSPQKDKNNQDD